MREREREKKKVIEREREDRYTEGRMLKRKSNNATLFISIY